MIGINRTLLGLPACFGLALALLPSAAAQAPTAAPAGATGICKDGTYSTAASKDGACRGHKGVQSWYSVPAKPAPATPSNQALPAPTPTPVQPAQTPPAPRTSISAERAKLATMQPAPGGSPGLVWLNGSSKVYHCPGTEFYGKTKTGAYIPEADAKAKGAHPDHNKPCS